MFYPCEKATNMKGGMATYHKPTTGLTVIKAALKRGFDILASGGGLLLTFWLIIPSWLAATWDTGANGFFIQERVDSSLTTTVTTAGDARVTPLGRFFRRTKLDELPQLINVFKGDMSFVGPRPDVPGYADTLAGEDRLVLAVRPGITGPATLKYRNEEELLAGAVDPERYNDEVIYPDKVRLNREYVQNWSFWGDLRYIWQTIFG